MTTTTTTQTARPRIGQITCKGSHTDDFGRVTAIRKDGFYARYRQAGGHNICLFHRYADVVDPVTLSSEIDGTRHVMLCK